MGINWELFNKGILNVIFQMHSGQIWQTACREWVLFYGGSSLSCVGGENDVSSAKKSLIVQSLRQYMYGK